MPVVIQQFNFNLPALKFVMSKYYFIWTEERHSVGIASVDSEHREIAERVNRIVSEAAKGTPYDAVKEMLNEMIVFVGEHFAHEERLMSEYGYPEMEKHVEEHSRLTRQLNNITRTDPKAALAPAFLIDWMEQHILQDDMEFGNYMTSNGINQSTRL